MSIAHSKTIRDLYTRGMEAHEICQRLRTSQIFTRNTIARLVNKDSNIEAEHLRNKRLIGRKRMARLINDDPHWEAAQ